MAIPEYQQRVIEEKNDLLLKVESLGWFVNGDEFKTFTEAEKNRLTLQLVAMRKYLSILNARIVAFEIPAEDMPVNVDPPANVKVEDVDMAHDPNVTNDAEKREDWKHVPESENKTEIE